MTPIPVPCPHCGAVLKIRDPKLIGHRAKCPKCAQVFRLEVAVAAVAVAETGVTENTSVSESVPAPMDALPSWPVDAAPVSVAAQLQAQRQQKRRRLLIGTGISALVLLSAGLVAGYIYQTVPKRLPLDIAAAESGADASDDMDQEPSPIKVEPSDTKPDPIRLKYIPAGTRIVIHLRPSEFWKPESQGEEFRFCLGPIGEFLAAKFEDLAKRKPADVAEAIFCLIPNERGTPPDVAAVFTLHEDAKKSQLLDDFGSRRMEASGGAAYYVNGERAYLLPDLKTIAVCPAKVAEEMVAAVNDPQPTSAGIDEMLFLTDRSHPLTILFEPVSTQIDAEFLVPSTAIPLLTEICDWLGSDVETVAWSLNWKQDVIRSEIIVRNQGGLNTRSLERDLKSRLNSLAKSVLAVVEQMHPQQAGRRQLIGRFPAMVKAYTLATRTQPAARSVKFVTVLPERAAPNLALGALLTWDEANRTTFKPASPAGDSGKDQPDNTPLAEKLQRKISVEFKKTPLQVAFDTIAEEIKAKVAIDGDGLKLAAYTKNMEQNFVLENTPAIRVIEKILKQPMYEKMCLVVDTTLNQLLITTYAAAEQKGQTPYQFPQ